MEVRVERGPIRISAPSVPILLSEERAQENANKRIFIFHTHTHTYIYIYIEREREREREER